MLRKHVVLSTDVPPLFWFLFLPLIFHWVAHLSVGLEVHGGSGSSF